MPPTSSLPKVPLPSTYTEYRALRAVRINGVALKPGERLPADSPVRRMPARLGELCRTHVLEVIPPELPPPTSQRDGLELLDKAELAQLCRNRKLPTGGDTDAMLRRLRAALE